MMSGFVFERKTFDNRDSWQNLIQSKGSKKNLQKIKEQLTNLDFTDVTSPWTKNSSKHQHKTSTNRKKNAFSSSNAQYIDMISSKGMFGPQSVKQAEVYPTKLISDNTYKLTSGITIEDSASWNNASSMRSGPNTHFLSAHS